MMGRTLLFCALLATAALARGWSGRHHEGRGMGMSQSQSSQGSERGFGGRRRGGGGGGFGGRFRHHGGDNAGNDMPVQHHGGEALRLVQDLLADGETHDLVQALDFASCKQYIPDKSTFSREQGSDWHERMRETMSQVPVNCRAAFFLHGRARHAVKRAIYQSNEGETETEPIIPIPENTHPYVKLTELESFEAQLLSVTPEDEEESEVEEEEEEQKMLRVTMVATVSVSTRTGSDHHHSGHGFRHGFGHRFGHHQDQPEPEQPEAEAEDEAEAEAETYRVRLVFEKKMPGAGDRPRIPPMAEEDQDQGQSGTFDAMHSIRSALFNMLKSKIDAARGGSQERDESANVRSVKVEAGSDDGDSDSDSGSSSFFDRMNQDPRRMEEVARRMKQIRDGRAERGHSGREEMNIVSFELIE